MQPSAFRILHEDAHLVFVDKPAKMLAVPVEGAEAKGPSLVERLNAEGRGLIAVHRLDYETSGVIVFAKDQETADALIGIFRRKLIKKVYQALVHGWLQPPSGDYDFPIKDLGADARISPKGEAALTHYSSIEKVGPCTLVRIEIETGRHNQVRLHFAHSGHPLIGERKYARGAAFPVKHGRVLLHAREVAFQPPHLKHVLRIQAPLPPDFLAAVEKARAVPCTSAPKKIAPLAIAEGPYAAKKPHAATMKRSAPRAERESRKTPRRGLGRVDSRPKKGRR